MATIVVTNETTCTLTCGAGGGVGAQSGPNRFLNSYGGGESSVVCGTNRVYAKGGKAGYPAVGESNGEFRQDNVDTDGGEAYINDSPNTIKDVYAKAGGKTRRRTEYEYTGTYSGNRTVVNTIFPLDWPAEVPTYDKRPGVTTGISDYFGNSKTIDNFAKKVTYKFLNTDLIDKVTIRKAHNLFTESDSTTENRFLTGTVTISTGMYTWRFLSLYRFYTEEQLAKFGIENATKLKIRHVLEVGGGYGGGNYPYEKEIRNSAGHKGSNGFVAICVIY